MMLIQSDILSKNHVKIRRKTSALGSFFDKVAGLRSMEKETLAQGLVVIRVKILHHSFILTLYENFKSPFFY